MIVKLMTGTVNISICLRLINRFVNNGLYDKIFGGVYFLLGVSKLQFLHSTHLLDSEHFNLLKNHSKYFFETV